MAHEVKMPQLGESVFEGQIGKWLKQPGEHVEKYEPLLEVITDKVDTEVTAVESGTLLKILVPEGETVKVGTLLAVIGEAGGAAGAAGAGVAGGTAVDTDNGTDNYTDNYTDGGTDRNTDGGTDGGVGGGAGASGDVRVTPVAARVATEHGVDVAQVQGSGPGGQVRREDVERHLAEGPAGDATATAPVPASDDMRSFISPRVAGLAMALGVDLRAVAGSGEGGRITARDVEAAAASAAAVPAATAAPAAPALVAAAPAAAAPAEQTAVSAPARGTAVASPMIGEIMELTPMRRAIADHMVRSKATSPHVTTVHEVDMGAVAAAREVLKAQFAERGVNLTYTAFIIHAAAQALAEHPMVNSSWTDAGIKLHRDVNIGMAVAIPQGLIVPVLRNADQKSLMGVARDIGDLASRARNKQLSPDDVQGGTFTLTNYGTLGSLFGTPVISQPQVAILGTGAIVKRVVVVEGPGGDSIAIRPMMFLALTFDHRVLDGGMADPFLRSIVERLQNYQA